MSSPLRKLTEELRDLVTYVETGEAGQDQTKDFAAALQAFLSGAQQKINDHFAKSFPSLTVPTLSVDPKGVKYLRIVRSEGGSSKSVHCFIDKTNGDVLKSESWKKPAKHARGNIFDADHGLKGVTEYGGVYMK